LLYVTTRNHQNAVTVQHVLFENTGPDSGLYLPLHFPVLSGADLTKFTEVSFNQRIAEMLNMFFCTKLTGWDVDFAIGRYPVRLHPLSHRIIMAETWHNPKWRYFNLEKKLLDLIGGQADASGNWLSVAVRMAILAAILMEQTDNTAGKVDICCDSGDFTVPVSAWYLRKMGFPIGNIICCSNESNGIWDLICLGQMKTDSELPVNLERLIHGCGGIAETEQYVKCCNNKEVYSVSDWVLQELRMGLHVSVVSENRTEMIIPNVFNTHNYVLQSRSALAYSGLMDYRAKTGVTRSALVFCDESPVCEAAFVAKCMSLSKEEFLRFF